MKGYPYGPSMKGYPYGPSMKGSNALSSGTYDMQKDNHHQSSLNCSSYNDMQKGAEWNTNKDVDNYRPSNRRILF